MSEMVERVARAIHAEQSKDWGGEFVSVWTDYVGCARAAILAMREPTEEMLDAGFTAVCVHCTVRTKSAGGYVYRTMIDEALK